MPSHHKRLQPEQVLLQHAAASVGGAAPETQQLTSWHGLSLPIKSRSYAGSAGFAPPFPVRYITQDAVSVTGFMQASAAATATMEQALQQHSLVQDADGVLGDEDLDMCDLQEPSPLNILQATTCEVAVPVAPTALDVRWQPWYRAQAGKRPPAGSTRSKGRKRRAAACNSTDEQEEAGQEQQEVGGQEEGGSRQGKQPKLEVVQEGDGQEEGDLAGDGSPSAPGPGGSQAAGDHVPAPHTRPQLRPGQVSSRRATRASWKRQGTVNETAGAGEGRVAGDGDAAAAAAPSTTAGRQAPGRVRATSSHAAPSESPDTETAQEVATQLRPNMPAGSVTSPQLSTARFKLKEPHEVTPEEWREMYRSHNWVYDRLGVMPCGAQPGGDVHVLGSSGLTVAGVTAAAVGGLTAVAVGSASQQQPGQQQERQQQQQQGQERQQGQGNKGSTQLFITGTAAAGAGLTITALEVKPWMVDQWKQRLGAAQRHLASLQELAGGVGVDSDDAEAEAAGERDVQQGPGQGATGGGAGRSRQGRGRRQQATESLSLDMLLLQDAVTEWSKQCRSRLVTARAARDTQQAAQAAQAAPQAAPHAGQPSASMRAARDTHGSAAGPEQGRQAQGPGAAASAQLLQAGRRLAAGGQQVEAHDEVLVHVCVYHPRRHDLLSDEYLVLGSQPLSVLVDQLYCVAGHNLASVNRHGSGGSYLFVEGCFYNDTRQAGARDLSGPIIKLCTKHKVTPRHVEATGGGSIVVVPDAQETATETAHGTAGAAGVVAPHRVWAGEGGGSASKAGVRSAIMQDTTFKQLTARLSNQPTYLLCHLGCCEHVIQIRDVRRMHPTDPAAHSDYPLQLLAHRAHTSARTARRCDVCETNPAEHVAYDDPLGPANPAFYCSRCLTMLHPNGQHSPSCQVYPYRVAVSTITAADGVTEPTTAAPHV